MAPILDRVVQKLVGITLVLAFMVVTPSPAGSAGMQLTQEEIAGFFGGLYTAFSACDLDWVERSFSPAVSISVAIEGQSAKAVPLNEYMQFLRKNCKPSNRMTVWEQNQFSFSIRPDHAVIRGRVAKGPMSFFLATSHFLGINPDDIESFEAYDMVRRGDDGLLKRTEMRDIVRLKQPSL